MRRRKEGRKSTILYIDGIQGTQQPFTLMEWVERRKTGSKEFGNLRQGLTSTYIWPVEKRRCKLRLLQILWSWPDLSVESNEVLLFAGGAWDRDVWGYRGSESPVTTPSAIAAAKTSFWSSSDSTGGTIANCCLPTPPRIYSSAEISWRQNFQPCNNLLLPFHLRL